MSRLGWSLAVALSCAATAAPAATADQGARGPVTTDLRTPVSNPSATTAVVVDEGFDDVTTLPGSGWTIQNNSAGVGSTDWYQGADTVFAAYDGATTAYIAANYNSTDGSPGTISTWLVSPPINFGNGASVSFYTRTTTGSTFPDRLQVRLCTAMPCTGFGAAGDGTGDYATLLLDINPTEAVGGYPDSWTQFNLANADGLPTSGVGRVAFRYYVHDGGLTGSNSNYIGIDRVQIEEGTAAPPLPAYTPVPSLGVMATLGLGLLLVLFGLVAVRRRHRA